MEEEKKPRIWFYPPQLFWFGWKTLLPISLGGDEWSRRTIVFGWNITGRMIIALWTWCKHPQWDLNQYAGSYCVECGISKTDAEAGAPGES